MKTLLLLGYGKMANALALGLKENYTLEISGRDEKKIQNFCKQHNLIPLKASNTFDINNKEVLLCVKPYALQDLHFTGKAKCVYSILNGVSLESLKEKIDSKNYIRAMPNVSASLKKSITSLCGDENAKKDSFDIFNSIGKCVWIEEKSMPIATALGGCAPAFLALIAESLMDAGVINGLNREEATQITQGLFEGFSTLLDSQSANTIKESVMSPGGSTAKGIESLEIDGLRGIIQKAILASKIKA